MTRLVLDDLMLEHEATQNADYLSFEWKLEDLWATKRYLRRRKAQLEHYWRLENALWRTWVKQEWRLQSSSARLIEWDKEADITWLYGPWKRNASFCPPLSTYQLRAGELIYLSSSLPARGPCQNKLGTGDLQGILLPPLPSVSHELTKRRVKKSPRVRFNQEVQRCLYLPHNIHWEATFWQQMCKRNRFWSEEEFHHLHLLFKVHQFGRTLLPLPSARLKPIERRALHSSSLSAIFYFEGPE